MSHFRNVTSLVRDDGALIRWEYWGPENNIYVEYKNKDSKQRRITSFLSVPPVGGKRRRLHLCPVQVNKKKSKKFCHVTLLPAPANMETDVINSELCDWIAN